MTLSPEAASAIALPRRDLLLETEGPAGIFRQVEGPFKEYTRTVTSEPTPDGQIRVDEVTEYRLAIPLWGPGINILMKRALRSPDRRPRARWWWPQEVVTSTTTQIIALMAVLAISGGYLGTLIGQTITFAARQFEASDSAQANTLGAVRIGILVSVLLIWRADRIGRKPLLIGFTLGAILFTAAGAFTPNLLSYGVTQALARGLTTGLLTLITITSTEEIPATMRAFILSILTMAGALGAGMVLWVLPLADLDPGGWRVAYLVPLLFLPVLWWVHRTLPETRRFSAADAEQAPSQVQRNRFLMIGGMVFLLAIFAAPASQLQNEYLSDDLDFSASQISVFRLIVSFPAGLFVVGAGYLADRRGRKVIGGIGIALGSVLSVLFFASSGLLLWVVGALGIWVSGAAAPVMRGYQTELFSTRTRAKVGGWLDVVAVSGSAVGLFTAALLIDSTGSISSALPWLLPFAMAAVAIILVFFPETASAELEEFNPTDPDIPHPGLSPSSHEPS